MNTLSYLTIPILASDFADVSCLFIVAFSICLLMAVGRVVATIVSDC